MGHLLKFLNVSSFWDTADNVYDLYVRKCILPGALYQVLKGSVASVRLVVCVCFFFFFFFFISKDSTHTDYIDW